MAKPKHVFVYGTLMSGYGADINKFGMDCVRQVGERTIHGQMFNVGAFPGVILNDGDDTVHGELYEILDDRIILALDRYEGTPNLYTREVVNVLEDGIETYVYQFNSSLSGLDRVESGNWRQREN